MKLLISVDRRPGELDMVRLDGAYRSRYASERSECKPRRDPECEALAAPAAAVFSIAEKKGVAAGGNGTAPVSRWLTSGRERAFR